MKIRNILSVLFLIVVAQAQVSFAQVHFSADERRIITLTDERRGTDTLLAYLTSPVTRVAWRAAIGLGNIGDTAVRAALLERFRAESRDSVADAEAFALGLLGPNSEVYEGMAGTIFMRPSRATLIAMARTAPESAINNIVKLSALVAEQKKLPERDHAAALVCLANRKLSHPRMMDDLELLAANDDPEVRWQTAFVFARVADSLNISHRFDILKELLHDQGTPYARMFAATAIGRAHNLAGDTLLTRAYRGETDWRVRVNILNALAKAPEFDSAIFAVIRSATEQATSDDPQSIHIGVTAQHTLNSFITGGKLTPSDSARVRDYLDAFNGFDGRNQGVAPIVTAEATLSAARLATFSLGRALDNYMHANDPAVRAIAIRAAGLTTDTVMFYDILASMPAVSAAEEIPRLEALDSMWTRATRGAKPDTRFRQALERSRAANVYRTMLMRVSDVVLDPAVATIALDHLCDSTIAVDTFRTQAERYLRKYLRSFAVHQFRDELLASVTAEAWFRDPSPEVPVLLRLDYDSAREWHDTELMDSIKVAMRALGSSTADLKPPLPLHSSIDWAFLESLPDKMLIGLARGSLQLNLRTSEAPLTVLNMARLARDQFFPGQKFHRVVPNFVIQSGDPTGTGYGGPGYAIRTEISMDQYGHEGVVGMASSGKDTEGSQWFITQCPTPHLDGRYTIWAEVQGGMEEVVKIQVGDKITSSLTFH